MSFKEYLKKELNRNNTNEYYEPNGNSERAVVTRGFWGEVSWQYKVYPKRIAIEIKCFDGLSTELGWFIQLPLMIILSPLLPLLAARHWYNKSLSTYKREYKKSINKSV